MFSIEHSDFSVSLEYSHLRHLLYKLNGCVGHRTSNSSRTGHSSRFNIIFHCSLEGIVVFSLDDEVEPRLSILEKIG